MQLMHALCEEWSEGNRFSTTACGESVHPNEWDGRRALEHLENCRGLSGQCSALEVTTELDEPAYFGPKIELGAAEVELTQCIERATGEIGRKTKFLELSAAGSENLAALKAQLSLTAGFNP
eukprot:COSAG04_NODE_15652_length_525_cov_0.429577_2_plen_121_part_01